MVFLKSTFVTFYLFYHMKFTQLVKFYEELINTIL